ncbi:glycerol-3-phosphate dehydrogenase [Halomonas sp. McH1-25]|uniref:glycerol-3-phosphate dehydrogenase n=1 Tax=unclassified Halomonas TaxID=2609666 RepID=UPI001EF48695|nr:MULTISPECIES: glycerol-3-phosphate dehydrogenase [unclassified Halomonas]MCG7601372.1 glycerol-3-phosphate dehydrogenase [Halomonas sp. McH1-25]MCP1343516.1 glycerol-3-phosphate dehydrogenase [Halomonas sp. FL8]MCP1363056.1 glycerol-3-phosphate dehydrogenase [Halomonas sp. BBD45]MCP1365952.1 glycerol-3-phosphate dehydrogenase [Halomonas sp. BBD48]
MHSQRPDILDLFVIGGGINGTGIVNDAAGRGLHAGLCEQGDLAGATSSASSKLIHGGLRYLEYYEFRLVREALHEREVLMKKAPHIVWPLRFILPHRPHLRPAWMLRAGLFLYDHLSRRNDLPGAASLRFGADSPLKPDIRKGFEYSDCWVDDARLVVLNAIQARDAGAEILVRTRCVGAVEENGIWTITLEDHRDKSTFTRQARTLVNAAGPWVESFIRGQTRRSSRYAINMIKGSHIVTRRINTDERAYILQNRDNRIVFVLPYQQDYSLIGTTDIGYQGDPADIAISDAEIDYLLEVINDHFRDPLTRDDIVASYAGVRPLCDDEADNPSAMTRDYTLSLDRGQDDRSAPMLSVFGGKITTYRKLAETALAQLKPYLPTMGRSWTSEVGLPGGDIPGRLAYADELERHYPFLGRPRAERFASSYGRLCERFLTGKQSASELGEDFGAGLTRAEVDYLIDHEWARETRDILWRRTKLDLQLTEAQKRRLDDYLHYRQQPSAVLAAEPAVVRK